MHPAPQSFRTSRLESFVSHNSFSRERKRLLTRTIEAPACGDIKHGPGDGKQNPPAVVATILCERARSIRLEEQRRSMGAGLP